MIQRLSLVLLLLLLPAPGARAEIALLAGADLTRPRILFFPEGVAAVQARLGVEPYLTILADMDRRTRLADGIALDDPGITASRFKARAAKNLAFLYAIDRRWDGSRAVPFASAAERRAVGDRVRDLLVNLYDRSRLAVPAPIGGWDRDISTSEELLQFATAYDTLLGAGYPFDPADEARIVTKLANLASEVYVNYTRPETAADNALIHQNNHRSKTGASLVVAAIVLAEYAPAAGSDPEGLADPERWLEYGLEQVDLIQRWALMTGDGAYAEGPFYQRFTHQNLLPFSRAWDRLIGGRTVVVNGHEIPSLWSHPLWARNQRWLLDMTLSDGSLAHIDDGNPGRTHYFGLFDPASPLADAFARAWAEAPTPFETDGNIDLAADALVHYDAASRRPGSRAGSPTSFWSEGGNAIFRSDWSRDGVVAVVLGEPEIASELGRDREGLGLSPESHEHTEPGSFLLHAYGERLALDPGYLDFTRKGQVDRPEHHNLILVDGVGPSSLFGSSWFWNVTGLQNRPVADGIASLAGNLDGDFLDATRVVARYGRGVPTPEAPLLERRFLFADDRYLVALDAATDPTGAATRFTWLLHGNGGGSSGGSFEPLPGGGRWSIGRGRLDAAFAFADAAPQVATATAVHEGHGKARLTHTVLQASVAEAAPRAVAFLHPSETGLGSTPAEIRDLALPGVAALRLEHPPEDRRAVAFHRRWGGDWALPDAPSGLSGASTDGVRGLFDAHLDGRLRLAWVEEATRLGYAGRTLLESVTPGNLGLRVAPRILEAVVETADPWVRLPALPFRPRRVDGACRLARRDGAFWVELGRERRFRVRADRGNSQPAADPGPDRRVERGARVLLDASASCDPDGDRLTPRWSLVSAPPGSAWQLEGADRRGAVLLADRPGPYRVQLVVTDARGATSRESEVRILAGTSCEGSVDEDLDGLFDSDDPDCDAPSGANRPPLARDDHFRLKGRRAFELVGSVLANDSDPDAGDALVAVLARSPRRGHLWLRPDGSFRYRPGRDFRRADHFTYRTRDAHGAESPDARVSLQLGPHHAPRGDSDSDSSSSH